ncbi:MAG: hypothetical protein J4G03_06085 [Gemmatimonadetes bacterium]|nr:hypothetical protein [Gemmatimonadota bacterium]
MDSRLEGIEDHLENIAKDTNAMAISLETLVEVVGSIRVRICHRRLILIGSYVESKTTDDPERSARSARLSNRAWSLGRPVSR